MSKQPAALPVTTLRHESVLGSWSISTCQPLLPLQPLVATIWFGQGSVSYQRDRILPSGQSQLLINLGPPQYMIEPGPPERRIPFRDVWYSGLRQDPIDTEAPHGSALLGVAFRAHGAFPWLGGELSDVKEQVLPLADLLGSGVLALRERLLNTQDTGNRFLLVQQWILARMRERSGVHPAVQWTMARLAASGGDTTIDTLARAAGYSRKHLLQLFYEQVGMRPKALARVLRFRSALGLMQGAQRVPWAELAAHCGYYDQAHLSNDFRRFAGVPPATYLRLQQPDSQSVVLR